VWLTMSSTDPIEVALVLWTGESGHLASPLMFTLLHF
jgi:hypothetical protein